MLPVARWLAIAGLVATACGPAPEPQNPAQLRAELVMAPMPLKTPPLFAPLDCGKLRQEAAQLSSACAREMLRGCTEWDDCPNCSAHDRKRREIADAKCQ